MVFLEPEPEVLQKSKEPSPHCPKPSNGILLNNRGDANGNNSTLQRITSIWFPIRRFHVASPNRQLVLPCWWRSHYSTENRVRVAVGNWQLLPVPHYSLRSMAAVSFLSSGAFSYLSIITFLRAATAAAAPTKSFAIAIAVRETFYNRDWSQGNSVGDSATDFLDLFMLRPVQQKHLMNQLEKKFTETLLQVLHEFGRSA